jgi:hypothetical protein
VPRTRRRRRLARAAPHWSALVAGRDVTKPGWHAPRPRPSILSRGFTNPSMMRCRAIEQRKRVSEAKHREAVPASDSRIKERSRDGEGESQTRAGAVARRSTTSDSSGAASVPRPARHRRFPVIRDRYGTEWVEGHDLPACLVGALPPCRSVRAAVALSARRWYRGSLFWSARSARFRSTLRFFLERAGRRAWACPLTRQSRSLAAWAR